MIQTMVKRVMESEEATPSARISRPASRLPIEIYHRKLTHWRQQGSTCFVTFRLADAIPQEQLRQLKEHRRRWELAHPEPRSKEDWHEYAREITQKTDRRLDDGYGKCHFRDHGRSELGCATTRTRSAHA